MITGFLKIRIKLKICDLKNYSMFVIIQKEKMQKEAWIRSSIHSPRRTQKSSPEIIQPRINAPVSSAVVSPSPRTLKANPIGSNLNGHRQSGSIHAAKNPLSLRPNNSSLRMSMPILNKQAGIPSMSTAPALNSLAEVIPPPKKHHHKKRRSKSHIDPDVVPHVQDILAEIENREKYSISQQHSTPLVTMIDDSLLGDDIA
ncbi:hypothetical protein TRFO_42719 [Tritrichomonas foetus]|uniref:Uncharacterized protein n=1 Tax=Tritrichomonas foetus TaxID=1144522 RepID=A0A1J4KZP1_9EUKA|nr:hypothetical protein TRFO_42719 [Tritrichomonas foetus]|eukprot:OHT15061.1 hypothetical protein TRFO_42719 [Tritrichomonas foetus]